MCGLMDFLTTHTLSGRGVGEDFDPLLALKYDREPGESTGL